MNSDSKNTPTVYVLELAGDKFYVGKSNDVQRRYDEHIRGGASEWTKIHKVIRVIETRENMSEDAVVLEYMKMKGIENVRGGAFSQIDISPHVPTIESLIRSRDDSCFKCGKFGHFAADCEVITAVNDWLLKNKGVIKQKIQTEIARSAQNHFIEELQQKTGFGSAAGKMIYAAVSEIFEAEFTEAKKRDYVYKTHACNSVMPELVEKMAASRAKKLYGVPVSPSSSAAAAAAAYVAVHGPTSATSANSANSNGTVAGADAASGASNVTAAPACSRCGRNNHAAEKCFAKTRADGSQI